MENLPVDIIEIVKNDFAKEDWQLIFSEIEIVRRDLLNVGDIQLIRSMIALCQGNRYKFLNIRNNKYLGDPRDVISLANKINPDLDSGISPFDVDKLKPGWVSEFWTRDARISASEKLKLDNWIYSDLFTDTQYNLKPKVEGNVTTLHKFYLEGESLSEVMILNNTFLGLPDQVELERIIYTVLTSNNLHTECYWITFRQGYTYHHDRGAIGEYEFENKKLNKVGNGVLYPLYSNLINEDVGQSFEYSFALGTALISKDFNWFLLFHLNKEKELYIEILAGGEEIFKRQMDEMCGAYL